MRVLVTGAAGFSGRSITDALVEAGHEVSALVHTNALDASRWNAKTSVLSGDLAGNVRLPTKLDAVVHAAARSPAPGVTADDMVASNVAGTERLVKHAARSGVRTFVFLSSLSVYGTIDASVVDESTPIRDPDVYGITKRRGEELLAAEASWLRSLSIRLPGVLGKGSVRNWMTNVLTVAREGRDLSVFNPDAPFNNAIHVSDLAQLVRGVLEGDWRGADFVTVAAAGQISVLNAVKTVVETLGSSSRINVLPGTKKSFVVSSARARELYGYHPMEISALLKRFAEENRAA
jgi:nucleoside-diphosphate-sugar epimerase